MKINLRGKYGYKCYNLEYIAPQIKLIYFFIKYINPSKQ